MKISELLPVGAIVSHLQARDKKQAIKQLASYASTLCNLTEKEIFSAVAEREKMGCTGMGSGVCIPHGRFAKLDKLLVVFARLDNPIDFGATDGRKVDLIFLLLTPLEADTEHLKALSVISKILRDKQLCENLRKADDADSLYKLLMVDL